MSNATIWLPGQIGEFDRLLVQDGTLAELFLIGGLQRADVYQSVEGIWPDSGWGFGMMTILEKIGFKIFDYKAGPNDNSSDGWRHVIYDVGTGEFATHQVDIQWNKYDSTWQQVEKLCSSKVKIKKISEYKKVFKNEINH